MCDINHDCNATYHAKTQGDSEYFFFQQVNSQQEANTEEPQKTTMQNFCFKASKKHALSKITFSFALKAKFACMKCYLVQKWLKIPVKESKKFSYAFFNKKFFLLDSAIVFFVIECTLWFDTHLNWVKQP